MIKIVKDNIEYTVTDGEKVTLTQVINLSSDTLDLTIPRCLEGRDVWDIKYDAFFYGWYNTWKTIMIEDGIHISGCAFRNVRADTIIWPKSEDTIPLGCFENCKIRKLENIQNVVKIGTGAFSNASIDSFIWPAVCRSVPCQCFAHSHIKTISGLENVENIGYRAFCDISFEKLDFSGAVMLQIEDEAFLNIEKERVLFPYYQPVRKNDLMRWF